MNTWKENQLLGEAFQIKNNLLWEQTRYLSAMVYNSNATKRSQMVKPEQLFTLPQDKIKSQGKPKSTKEQYEAFSAKVDQLNSKKEND